MSRPPENEFIEETTVGILGDFSAGVSNIWEREYTTQSGQKKKGLSANVSLWTENREFKVYVGEGDVIDLGKDGKWKVVRVDKGEGGENGGIEVMQL